MYYLNFSETCDKSKTFYQIKILLSKSIKTKKNNIVNCLSDSIHKIIELQEIEKKIKMMICLVKLKFIKLKFLQQSESHKSSDSLSIE